MKYFDILSIKPELKVKGDSRYHTPLGISLGIFSIFFLIIMSVIFINDVVQRKKINVIYNLDNRLFPTVNTEGKYLGFALTDTFGKEIPNFDRVFNVKVKFWEYTFPNVKNSTQVLSTPTGKFREVYLKDCKEIGKENNYYKLMGNIYKSASCFDFSNNNITTIYGRYGSIEGFSTLNFYFNRCLNSTLKKDCYPEIEIEKILSGIILTILTTEYDVVTDDIHSPLQEYTKTDQIPISSTIYKKIVKEYNRIVFKDDKGILNEDKQYTESYRTEALSEFVDIKTLESKISPGLFSQFSIRCSGKNEIYTRNFQKLQTAFANIAGFLQLIFFVGRIIIYFWSKNSMMDFIILQVFDVKESMRLIQTDINSKTENLNKYIKTYANINNNNSIVSLKNLTKNKEILNLNENNMNISKFNNFEIQKNENIQKTGKKIKLDLNQEGKKKNTCEVEQKEYFQPKIYHKNIYMRNVTNYASNLSEDLKKVNLQKSDKLDEKMQSNTDKEIIRYYQNVKFLNIFDKICWSKFICDKHKRSFVSFANKIIDKKVSVDYFLNSFSTLEKITDLLLNDEQKENLVSIPNCNMEKHFKNISFHTKNSFNNLTKVPTIRK